MLGNLTLNSAPEMVSAQCEYSNGVYKKLKYFLISCIRTKKTWANLTVSNGPTASNQTQKTNLLGTISNFVY